ncbi:C2H2 type master regulator of conidiophore development brlA [Fusarium oxysporum f. sp. rapae]|uniref:C2H2 type master regulator of conidiophore development brlA n=1 Tax=Fusarium oxysporum f. sp. rapae TaxID=485398 RepID=A0A8J5NDV4_FUSOX|nr:C2H2 type master regulator of conidiophore development brlA [Fusarium oxysporum f. sp. rapae]KAG7403442.1 C2H2 type master regulator of conidiophore development brlA [Fusarium oxysporum f. sp. rapae]
MARQIKSDFQLDIDSYFSFPSQSMSCPFTLTSFSSASSSYDPFTPISQFSTLHESLAMEFDGSYNNGSHGVDAAPLSTVGNFMLDAVVKTKTEQMPFPDGPPNTPMKQEFVGLDYREMNMEHNGSMGSLTPLSLDIFAISPEAVISASSFVMTPTQMPSGFEAADIYPPWSCASDSPISFLQSNYEVLDIDHQSVSPYHVHDSTPPMQTRALQMMVNEIQRKTADLQYAQIRRTRKRSVKPDAVPVDPVWSSCDYPGCDKAFQRKEHLKRHKQSFHGEGPNRFSCEFCGKDQFNRRDNLNHHRKLHARPNKRSRGVDFVADAVLVIEQEKRSRRRRALPKAKQLKKRCLESEADGL